MFVVVVFKAHRVRLFGREYDVSYFLDGPQREKICLSGFPTMGGSTKEISISNNIYALISLRGSAGWTAPRSLVCAFVVCLPTKSGVSRQCPDINRIYP